MIGYLSPSHTLVVHIVREVLEMRWDIISMLFHHLCLYEWIDSSKHVIIILLLIYLSDPRTVCLSY